MGQGCVMAMIKNEVT